MKTTTSIKNLYNNYFPDTYNSAIGKSKKFLENRIKRSTTKKIPYQNELIAGITFLAVSGIIYAILMNQKKNHIYQKKYDPGTVFKFQGRIIDIVHEKNGSEESEGVELILQTSDAVLPVHLGPAWYLEHQQLKLRKGEKVNVTGSMRLSGREEASVVAATVQRRGGKKLNLRDRSGNPYWYAWN